MIIAPSILNIPKEERNKKLKEYQEAGIYMLHLDIMDGKFVVPTTEDVSCLKGLDIKDYVLDTHLMVKDVEKFIKQFAKVNSDYITIHYEATKDIMPALKLIKNSGALCGLAIKPKTTVAEIKKYLSIVDMVLVMSVEPGYGGQKFMMEAVDKVKELDTIRNKNNNYSYQIEVDGGINLTNAPLLKDAGANIVVMGTFLYKSEDPKIVRETVDNL